MQMSSEDGGVFFEQECKVVRLDAGQTLFTPIGFLSHWLFFDAMPKKSSSLPEWAHVWQVPVFHVESGKKLDQRVLSSVQGFSEGYLTLQAAKIESFKDRTESFKAFFHEVAQ